MPYYELLCLASGRLNRKELTDVLRKTCRAFMDNGATVTRITPLGATGHGPRKLAYTIRQNQVSYDTGFYVNVCAFSSPSVIDEVRRQLRIDERMLRYIVTRRRTMDTLYQMADVDDVPPTRRTLDQNDPQYELQKFVEEFQRDFPEGISIGQSQSRMQRSRPVSVDVDGSQLNHQESSVRDILARLKAATPPTQKEDDVGLAWLSNLEKKDPPDDDKP